jgi:virulence-associated protein VapD
MFAIAFDLTVADAEEHHPKGYQAAYLDIAKTLGACGFERIQGSVYVNKNDDMAELLTAVATLKSLPWFPKAVRDVRGFKMESWSNFTSFVKTKI